MPVPKLSDPIADLLKSLATGTEEHFAGVPVLMLQGKRRVPAEIAAELRAYAQLRDDVNTAFANYQERLIVAAKQAPAARQLMRAYVALVRAAFGRQVNVLIDFGLTQQKDRTPLTSEQLAVAVAKRASTRQARGTKGPKARLKIKGDVTGVEITPVRAEDAQEAEDAQNEQNEQNEQNVKKRKPGA